MLTHDDAHEQLEDSWQVACPVIRQLMLQLGLSLQTPLLYLASAFDLLMQLKTVFQCIFAALHF